jgi:threonyl-tRNA synthetase
MTKAEKLLAFDFTVMAQVLEEMYPGIKLTLGPAISNGFIMMWILKIRKSLMLISKLRSCS